MPGDLFILANAKPEPISEIQLTGRSWSFASVTHLVSSISQIQETDGNGDVVEVEDVEEGTSLCFKIESSKEFEVDDSTSLFVAFLLNLIPSRRICNALQMSGNLKIIKEVLCPDSVVRPQGSIDLICWLIFRFIYLHGTLVRIQHVMCTVILARKLINLSMHYFFIPNKFS